MALDTKHPLYSEFIEDWQLMNDVYDGQRKIKSEGQKYLPPTAGQIIDGLNNATDLGLQNYNAYKDRAVFPEFVKIAVEELIGVMHHKPATIELPERLEPLLENATSKGESLQMLLRRINKGQLTTGRVGLLADVPDGQAVNEAMPYIALYKAEDIINWDDGSIQQRERQKTNLVVLDESEFKRDMNFDWTREEQYRVLVLGDLASNELGNTPAVYQMGLFSSDTREDSNDLNFDQGALFAPSIGGNTLDEIPFVFVNAVDIVPEPDEPPLLALANLSLVVYRGEADYRQSLHNQGQDTLVITGQVIDSNSNSTDPEGPVRTGAGAMISVSEGGDAKYIGVDSSGLSEQRTALENDKQQAAVLGSRLLDTAKGVESGEALRVRVSAKTASLNQIAKAGADALQNILRIMATWVGASPEEVIVTPNLDFTGDELDGRTLVEIMTAKNLGAPISNESIHLKLQEKDFTALTYEEELARIESEMGSLDGGDGIGVEDDAIPPVDNQEEE